ncbi:MAG: PilT/PilU family type 4a pilus ATPase [Armatimonadetes bacterium]|nr:PilT/PilU family type 4a pilus ATPase [Armatimonadota bacterium]MBM3947472.1 PilT/PilU family type 4a pilus ATPase [SAR202 cluster bacterium]
MVNIHELLELAIRHRASDLFLKAGSPPALRIDGTVVSTKLPALDASDTEELAHSVIYSASRDYLLRFHAPGKEPTDIPPMADEHMKQLTEKEEVDLVFTIPNLIRVRANLFLQQNTVAAALRIIPLHPFSVEELNLPRVLRELADARHGLILVAGPTGSGKSTTLAALLDHINSTRHGNIITVEDPIEYVFEDKKCVVYQREVGRDTMTFASGLRSVLRQSPDVIMLGEMRDAETMAVALGAAEMGHLVLTTVHTNSAGATVERIVNAFQPHERTQIRSQLAAVLTGIVSQRLLKRANGPGRVPAVEIMINTPSMRKHIDEGNTHEIYNAIRDGRHFGMNSMNQSLEKLVQAKLISNEDALSNAGNIQELRQLLRQG